MCFNPCDPSPPSFPSPCTGLSLSVWNALLFFFPCLFACFNQMPSCSVFLQNQCHLETICWSEFMAGVEWTQQNTGVVEHISFGFTFKKKKFFFVISCGVNSKPSEDFVAAFKSSPFWSSNTVWTQKIHFSIMYSCSRSPPSLLSLLFWIIYNDFPRYSCLFFSPFSPI